MLGFTRKEKTQEVRLTVTNQTFFRLAGLSVGTIILISAVQKASHAILLIFISFFLALALNSPVHSLSSHLPKRWYGSRTLATALSFFIVVLVLGSFIASLVPPLVKQTSNFVSAAPSLVKDFRNQDSAVGKVIRKYHLENQVSKVSSQLSDRLKNIGGSAFSSVQKIGSSAFSLLTILALTFMMLTEGPRWLAIAKDIIPDDKHEIAGRLANDMYRVVKGYVNGQVLLAALASVLILPAVILLHISYPAALIVIIFVCGLIPMVGHTIGAVIVTTVALFHSTGSAVAILAYYIFYQQVENYMIQPRIQANATNMSPLLVFASVVIGVSFGGLIGGLLAIPIGGCARIAILEYLRSKRIIDTPEFNNATTETK